MSIIHSNFAIFKEHLIFVLYYPNFFD